MLNYFMENPYWIIVIAVLVLLTLFVCIKAGKASSRRSKEVEKTMKRLKEENELRNEFAVITEQLAKNSAPERLFKGVALNLQKRVADADDMVAEFEKLAQEQREIYALSFVVEDGGEKLSEFFRANGQPLTGAALDAVKHLFSGRIMEIFKSEFNSFDPDNESASCIAQEIDALDGEFAQLVSDDVICRTAGAFIAQNVEKFI